MKYTEIDANVITKHFGSNEDVVESLDSTQSNDSDSTVVDKRSTAVYVSEAVAVQCLQTHNTNFSDHDVDCSKNLYELEKNLTKYILNSTV